MDTVVFRHNFCSKLSTSPQFRGNPSLYIIEIHLPKSGGILCIVQEHQSNIQHIFFVMIIQHTHSHSDYYEIVKNQLINEHSAPTNALFERLLQGGQVDMWTTVFGSVFLKA